MRAQTVRWGVPYTKPVIYTYNLDGSLATLAYPDTGEIITYTAGGAGRTLAAQDIANGVNYVQNAQYAPFGGLASLSNGAQPITTANSYNNRLQPVTLSAATTATTLLSLSYDFHLGNGDNDNVFQIVNNRDTNRTQNFTYDALNRIQQANSSGPNWGETFTIDAWGNLTNRGPVSGKTNYEGLSATALASNRLSGYGYDAAGNLTSNGSATYTYDAENRLLSTAGVNYYYDGDGKRVKKSGGTMYWMGMGSDALAESDLTGVIQREYIFFNGKRVARHEPSSSIYRYYFSDHLGSASVVTNATGAIKDESDYYPYGGERIIADGDANNYKFTGKERDSETGLDYFGARMYGSNMGRFLSPDPDDDSGIEKDPQSWNRYAYARNNPLLLTDPNGESYEVCQKDENGKNTNCATISDADFDKLSRSSKDIQYNNGNVTATNEDGSKTVLGSYRQIDVDLPGDPEANRQAAAMIVKTFDSAMKEFGKNALYSATGAVLVRGIGAAIEGVRAVQAVENIPITTHAAVRMAERGITQQAVDYAIESAQRVGNVATQTGKYGTAQEVFTGTNGITAVVETEGRNAGKVVTTYWTGSKP